MGKGQCCIPLGHHTGYVTNQCSHGCHPVDHLESGFFRVLPLGKYRKNKSPFLLNV